MRCERFDKLIYLFLDGRLNEGEEKKLKKHLSECKSCQKRLSFLESVEGRAKKIEIKEPPQKYWDTFSSRVREKILEREEKSFAFGLRKALQSIFSFSPLKIKVVAGVVSVVLVFIIGKLYVDYRGEEILPSRTVIQPKEPPRLDIMEMKKKEGFPIGEGMKRVKSASDKPEQEMKPAIVEETKEKAFPPEKPVDKEEGLLKEKEVPTPPKIAEDKPVPAYAPALPAEALTETEKPSEQAIISPEAKKTGAGVDREAEERKIAKVADSKRIARAGEEDSSQKEIEQLLAYTIGFVRKVPLPADAYSVDGNVIPGIQEIDTLIHADTLRWVIQVWRGHVEEHPNDSLTRDGYLQIATAYYLLAKLSQDTAVISEGSKLIEEYLDQIKDPMIQDKLGDKLRKIKALEER